MRKHFLGSFCALFTLTVCVMSLSFASVKSDSTAIKSTTAIAKSTETEESSARSLFNNYIEDIYSNANLASSGLDTTVFEKAITGYYNLKIANLLPAESTVVTIVDFSKPSTTKRMWIVDLAKKKLLLNTWVAHGQGSGDNVANAFSNNPESHQSSIGFYITNEVYDGKHGRSLRLDGMDAGFNDQARSRDIVVHGAEYVNQNTIDQMGRLGRSFGCPAVSTEVIGQVIEDIKNKNLLFINANESDYKSKYLDEDQAAKFAFGDSSYNLVKDMLGN
ncbi:L,D-transpeptidase-like protein [Mucilaginibacter yixingensis]|uniref:L,D-transpeptidase-like protein n=1 Tax=Mucilaginibacter yixingensis TaxID=1295612 RepID=A0A2T5J6H9_9SPHI|nr:murein L,D-transpeptidase catalytic domain family protein [Mucilaginibacter yixingensis]PTQ94155.1 L,D-transpeptidase-like protein [Mucilaginibacter yixingensis]